MKKLNVIFATLGLVFILAACSPSSEEVKPIETQEDLEKFEVKGTSGGQEGNKPKPGGL